MYNSQQENQQPGNPLDGPVAIPAVTDPEAQHLYQNGHISRPLAEIFSIIAGFNDEGGEGGLICSSQI